MSMQRSGKRMSPEKEGLCAMPGESCCAVGESKQDVDQWTQVIEGIVLPERVISELVISLFSLPTYCCGGLVYCYSLMLRRTWSILAALRDGVRDVGWTARVEGPLLQLLYHTIQACLCLLLCEIFYRNVLCFILSGWRVVIWTVCLQLANRTVHCQSIML